MKIFFKTIHVLAVGTALAWGQDAGGPVAEKAPVAAVPQKLSEAQALMKEVDDEMQTFMERYRASKTADERAEALKSRPVVGDRAGRVLALVHDHLQEEGAAEVVGWVLMKGKSEEQGSALDLMLQNFQDSPVLQSYVQNLGYGGTREEIEKVVSAATNERVLLLAKLQLASLVAGEGDQKGVAEAQAAKRAEAKNLLEELRDIKGIAENHPGIAKEVASKLFKIEHLGIGCEAPEIVGVDHAGEEFKLSDYRGKVTLIDFWGIW